MKKNKIINYQSFSHDELRTIISEKISGSIPIFFKAPVS